MRRISPAIRKEITQRLVDEFDPEAIYLFGSYAWGQPKPESDLDLLVIVQESQQQPVQRAVRAQHSLRGLPAAVDVLVKTSSEVERYRHVYASLEAQILEKGKLLYGRSQTRVGTRLALDE
jgi:predicted nucleotidyltransferase